MTVLKRYVLRLFISLKYVTANVVDRNNGRIVATASTVEHALKSTFECGRSCNAKAAAVVGDVLAMRLKVEGLEQGQGRGIHVDVKKEVEKKGFKNSTKIWAIVNALKNNGVKLILDDNDDTSRPNHSYQTDSHDKSSLWAVGRIRTRTPLVYSSSSTTTTSVHRPRLGHCVCRNIV